MYSPCPQRTVGKINKINYEPNIDYVYEVNFIYATIDLFKNTHKQKPFGYDQ